MSNITLERKEKGEKFVKEMLQFHDKMKKNTSEKAREEKGGRREK